MFPLEFQAHPSEGISVLLLETEASCGSESDEVVSAGDSAGRSVG